MANDNAQMAEFANNLWNNYIKQKFNEASKEMVSYYRAEVVSNDGNNRLTIQRPYDNPYQVPCTDAMNNAAQGDQVVVLKFGTSTNNNNHLVFTTANGNTNCAPSYEVKELEKSVGDNMIAYVETQYCLSSSSAVFYQYGDWSDEMPTFVDGKYYWRRTATRYVSGAIEYSDPIFSTTEQITAETEKGLASTNNHFWWNATGAYVTEQDGDASIGYATRAVNSGIFLSYNGNTLSSWTSSGMAFYGKDSNDVYKTTATYSAAGVDLYADGAKSLSIDGTNGIQFYASDGVTPIASFNGTRISLGKNSLSSVIDFCEGLGRIDAMPSGTGTTLELVAYSEVDPQIQTSQETMLTLMAASYKDSTSVEVSAMINLYASAENESTKVEIVAPDEVEISTALLTLIPTTLAMTADTATLTADTATLTANSSNILRAMSQSSSGITDANYAPVMTVIHRSSGGDTLSNVPSDLSDKALTLITFGVATRGVQFAVQRDSATAVYFRSQNNSSINNGWGAWRKITSSAA